MRPRRIISGGQTGVDRAALDWAIARGIPHGGWCPKGRLAEDGPIDPRYLLTETESAAYEERTWRNVRDSDGTLILNRGDLAGGSLFTLYCAERLGRSCLVVPLEEAGRWVEPARAWLTAHEIRVLNLAGPRASQRPGIEAQIWGFLDALFCQQDQQDAG
ncbi:molybdenum cofactor carrier [Caldichromatium japonicum]|uniref:Molybdenum cofactor carrier n=1 Tax=Caldichromatium japonicum TaxID=2699430 RepID=A0A6G7VGX9_9GAMM|nr:molybdenum cofactor carrier [Caldichromatium japonicum]